MGVSINSAQVVVKALRESGVDTCFTYPGDPIVHLMEECRLGGMDVVLARREASAAFMAEAAAMVTGGIGFCLSTLGPGSTALLNGVAAAHLDRVPMIAISGQIDTSREQYFTHQVIDHNQLFSPVSKWAGRIEPGSVSTVMRKAIRLAHAERPGPVHLTLPGDVSEQAVARPDYESPPLKPVYGALRVLSRAAMVDPVKAIADSKRPVILAGIAALRAGAGDSLRAFAESASIPVVSSPMAKGLFPEDHELFAGVVDMACNEVVWSFLAEADLILAVGFDAVELIKPWSLKVPVIHVDTLENTDQIYAAAIECVGDIGHCLQWFHEELGGREFWNQSKIQTHRDQLKSAYYAGRLPGKLNPTDVVDAVREAFPAGTIATTDVGSHKLLVGQGWRSELPRTMLMTNGLSSMGFGIPAAIAAKLTMPESPVVGMVGDGGFSMAATELRLASARNLALTLVVFSDGSLNRIELKQQARNFPSTATRIEDIDVVTLANALGCDGVRVGSSKELSSALSTVGSLKGPLVIDARIDPSQYSSQF